MRPYNSIGDDITPTYAAKNISQYLKLQRQPCPRPEPRRGKRTSRRGLGAVVAELLGGGPKEYKRMMTDLERESAKRHTIMDIAGLSSPDEKDSWRAMDYTGKRLEEQIGNPGESWVILPKARFADELSKALDTGITDLLCRYWFPHDLDALHDHINPDFKTKTQEWLISEIYKRTDKRFNFLSTLTLTPDQYGNVKVEKELKKDLF